MKVLEETCRQIEAGMERWGFSRRRPWEAAKAKDKVKKDKATKSKQKAGTAAMATEG